MTYLRRSVNYNRHRPTCFQGALNRAPLCAGKTIHLENVQTPGQVSDLPGQDGGLSYVALEQNPHTELNLPCCFIQGAYRQESRRRPLPAEGRDPEISC